MTLGAWMKVAGVAIGIGVLAACGTTRFPEAAGSGSGGARAELMGAAARTEAAKSAKFSLRASFGDKDVTGEGAVDFEKGNAQFTVQLDSLGEFEERVVDGDMYVRLPFGTAKWMKIDAGASGTSGGPAAGLSQLDPTKLLDYLRRISTDVTTVGSEKVRGADTTHYRATVEVPGGGSAPIDVWVDGDGRARKATFSANLVGSKVDVELEMYDFGAEVSVDAPPAGEVTSPGGILDDMLGGILGG